jgi:2-succinyl-5-enolpyruvyl-6-hydroxy-3-cyclohexene-1-carboxylate synthase
MNCARAKSKIYLDKIPFSDFKFFEKVIPSLPKTHSCKSATAHPLCTADCYRPFQKSIAIEELVVLTEAPLLLLVAVANEKQTVFITGDIGFIR